MKENNRNKVNNEFIKETDCTNMDIDAKETGFWEPGSFEAADIVKREYKDTVFRKLFSDKKNLLSLYNSLNNSDYTDEDILEVTTLENAIYLNMKNDVSFIIDDTLSLYEHQSSFNPNMPLRGLFYFAQQYDRIVKRNNLKIYGRKVLQLPTPRYIVFYNGTSEVEDIITLRLSDSFADKELAAVEIVAQCYNVNYGHNKVLLEACEPLMEYSKFIKVVRENIASERYGSWNAAVDAAIVWCIEYDILRDFLSQNRAEVIELLVNELYDYQGILQRNEEEIERIKKEMERIKKEKEEIERQAEKDRKEKEEIERQAEKDRKEKEETEQRNQQLIKEKDELINSMNDIADVKIIGLICDNLKKSTEVSVIVSCFSVDEAFVLRIKDLLDRNSDMKEDEIKNALRE